ncbi:hypothetical protein ACFFMR_28075 [Micromonospora andamanensis]|uniref:Uncharacterized protein n=1 Tax=Micromonospora andamanensis TaxID=1287068 RepID=A0ABQ4I0D4_9ACTN|nr:hypothetical protein [Micromonospora andamanensis]GIJ11383.1 hypothetical protein Van01_45970 [Micromonospora andamanensis]
MAQPDEFLSSASVRPLGPEHPTWCVADRDGIHYSGELPPWGNDRVVYATSSLFRMDCLTVPLVGVNLRLYAADLVEDYPLDLDQARILAWSLRRLVQRAGG